MQARVVKQDGLVKIEVNGERIDPVAFMTYRPDARIFADFARAGVRFASFGAYAPDHGINEYAGLYPMTPHFWVGEDTYDFSQIDRDLAAVCPTGKETYVFPRVYLNTPSWWEQKYPEELCRDDEGIACHESFASKRWREDAIRALHALMDHIEASPWRECVVGYHIAAGSTEEWTYHHYDNQIFRMDFSEPNRHAFGKWLERKYHTVDAWQAAWNKPCTDFSAPEFPSLLARCYAQNGSLRDPARERQTIDFWEYTNELFADTICTLCHAVKEHSGGNLLAGAFYGYNIFLIHPDKGHFALSKVLDSPDVDFIAATGNHPEAGGAWSNNASLTSANLRGKLFFCEGDIRTSLTRPLGEMLPHVVSHNNYYKSPVWAPLASMDLTVSAIKKASARVLTEGVGVWWFDMFGGAFDHPRVMELLEGFVDSMNKRTDGPLHRDIAYIIDESGVFYMRRNHSPADLINRRQIDSVSHMGAPVDMLEAKDLLREDFPADRYKLFILSGFLSPNEEILHAVKTKLMKKGKTVLWCQFSHDSFTGFQTVYDPYTTPVCGQFENRVFPQEAVTAPRFAKESLVGTYTLATFEGEHTPAVVAREDENGRSIVSLLPDLPPELLREIATLSGAHVYTKRGDVIYAGGNHLAIHACTAGEKRIYLPMHVRSMTDTDTGEEIELFDGIHTDLEMKEFETRLFRIDP